MEFKTRSIVINSAAGACVRYAADKLSEYAFKISGEKLTVTYSFNNEPCFLLGKTSAVSDFEYEEFTKKITGDGYGIFAYNGSVVIAAKTSRGIMYGVYGYIEKFLGARFLTAEAEYLPAGKLVLPEKDYVSNPDFAMRTYLVGDTFQEHADYDHIARTGIVDVFTHVDEAHGGKVKVYGRNSNHNFHYYVPFEVYGNEHPEFYRFFYVNAEITPTIDLTNGITDDGRLDMSMDVSVAKIVIEEMKKDLEKFPEAEVFCFTQEDGDYYYDSDRNRELEKKYKRSGILIRFCNVIVRELNAYLKRTGSKRTIKIMTFAYHYGKEAPVKNENGVFVPIDDTVKADENIIIQLALFRNGYYGYFDDKQYPLIKQAFSEWRSIAKDFWFWGYDTNFHRYLAYYDSVRNISADVRGFKERGITYLCTNGTYETKRIWQNNIRAYIYRKCMWDVSLDCNELLTEYLNLYYKVASHAVKNVMDMFHSHYEELEKEGAAVTCETSGTNEKAEQNPVSMLLKMLDVISSGEKAVKKAGYDKDEETELLRRLYEVKATPLSLIYDNYYFYYPNATDKEYQTARKAFFDIAAAAGIDYFAEHWSIEQYAGEPGASEKQIEKYNKVKFI